MDAARLGLVLDSMRAFQTQMDELLEQQRYLCLESLGKIVTLTDLPLPPPSAKRRKGTVEYHETNGKENFYTLGSYSHNLQQKQCFAKSAVFRSSAVVMDENLVSIGVGLQLAGEESVKNATLRADGENGRAGENESCTVVGKGPPAKKVGDSEGCSRAVPEVPEMEVVLVPPVVELQSVGVAVGSKESVMEDSADLTISDLELKSSKVRKGKGKAVPRGVDANTGLAAPRMTRARARQLENEGATTLVSRVQSPAKKPRARKGSSRNVSNAPPVVTEEYSVSTIVEEELVGEEIARIDPVPADCDDLRCDDAVLDSERWQDIRRSSKVRKGRGKALSIVVGGAEANFVGNADVFKLALEQERTDLEAKGGRISMAANAGLKKIMGTIRPFSDLLETLDAAAVASQQNNFKLDLELVDECKRADSVNQVVIGFEERARGDLMHSERATCRERTSEKRAATGPDRAHEVEGRTVTHSRGRPRIFHEQEAPGFRGEFAGNNMSGGREPSIDTQCSTHYEGACIGSSLQEEPPFKKMRVADEQATPQGESGPRASKLDVPKVTNATTNSSGGRRCEGQPAVDVVTSATLTRPSSSPGGDTQPPAVEILADVKDQVTTVTNFKDNRREGLVSEVYVSTSFSGDVPFLTESITNQIPNSSPEESPSVVVVFESEVEVPRGISKPTAVRYLDDDDCDNCISLPSATDVNDQTDSTKTAAESSKVFEADLTSEQQAGENQGCQVYGIGRDEGLVQAAIQSPVFALSRIGDDGAGTEPSSRTVRDFVNSLRREIAVSTGEDHQSSLLYGDKMDGISARRGNLITLSDQNVRDQTDTDGEALEGRVSASRQMSDKRENARKSSGDMVKDSDVKISTERNCSAVLDGEVAYKEISPQNILKTPLSNCDSFGVPKECGRKIFGGTPQKDHEEFCCELRNFSGPGGQLLNSLQDTFLPSNKRHSRASSSGVKFRGVIGEGSAALSSRPSDKGATKSSSSGIEGVRQESPKLPEYSTTPEKKDGTLERDQQIGRSHVELGNLTAARAKQKRSSECFRSHYTDVQIPDDTTCNSGPSANQSEKSNAAVLLSPQRSDHAEASFLAPLASCASPCGLNGASDSHTPQCRLQLEEVDEDKTLTHAQDLAIHEFSGNDEYAIGLLSRRRPPGITHKKYQDSDRKSTSMNQEEVEELSVTDAHRQDDQQKRQCEIQGLLYSGNCGAEIHRRKTLAFEECCSDKDEMSMSEEKHDCGERKSSSKSFKQLKRVASSDPQSQEDHQNNQLEVQDTSDRRRTDSSARKVWSEVTSAAKCDALKSGRGPSNAVYHGDDRVLLSARCLSIDGRDDMHEERTTRASCGEARRNDTFGEIRYTDGRTSITAGPSANDSSEEKVGATCDGPSTVAIPYAQSSRLVSNMTSFVPVIQRPCPTFIPNGKRDVKVKALEAAVAAKRLEEKREMEKRERLLKKVQDFARRNIEREKANENDEKCMDGKKVATETNKAKDVLGLTLKVTLADCTNSKHILSPKSKLTRAAALKKKMEQEKLQKLEEEMRKKEADRKKKEGELLARKQKKEESEKKEREEKRRRQEELLRQRKEQEERLRAELEEKEHRYRAMEEAEREKKAKEEEIKRQRRAEKERERERRQKEELETKAARQAEKEAERKRKEEAYHSLKSSEDYDHRIADGVSATSSAAIGIVQQSTRPSADKLRASNLSFGPAMRVPSLAYEGRTRMTATPVVHNKGNRPVSTARMQSLSTGLTPGPEHPTDITKGSEASLKPFETPRVGVPEPEDPGPQSYEISPYRESSDDEDEEEPSRPTKFIPLWARKENLMPQLLRQLTQDPDEIFVGSKTCSLKEVFGTSGSRKVTDFARRSGSGDWVKDRVCWKEELQYKITMGYMAHIH